MHFVHISDSHLTEDAPDRANDLQRTIDMINQYYPNTDAVVHTGDVAHNGSIEEYQTAQHIFSELNSPYFLMVGNKDNRTNLRQVFSEHRYLNSHTQFIQYAIDTYGTRLLMLDTLSDQSNKGELCSARLAHLQNMLDMDPTSPTIVFMHHSPFEVNAIPDPHQFENWSEVGELGSLLIKHPQVVQICCGHIHRNIHGQLGQLPVHAISCIATDLRKGELSPMEKRQPLLLGYAV